MRNNMYGNLEKTKVLEKGWTKRKGKDKERKATSRVMS